MKLVNCGLLNKFVNGDDKRLKERKNDIDNLNLALLTKHSPYKKPIELHAKNPMDAMNDPDRFIVTFQRICQK